MEGAVAVVAAVRLAYAVVERRLRPAPISGAMVFTAVGLLASDQRKLTARQAAFIGVGAMVGAGIFSLLEYVVRGLGNGHVTGIIAWLILAANAIVTGMVAVSFGSYASAALADSTSTCWRSPATPRSATSCPASP